MKTAHITSEKFDAAVSYARECREGARLSVWEMEIAEIGARRALAFLMGETILPPVKGREDLGIGQREMGK